MSDPIKHECGVALLRLLKPPQYYIDKYKTASYALNKMYLLMEKQHNRGQDGVGMACLKFDTPPGEKYFNRYRSVQQKPMQDLFKRAFRDFNKKGIRKQSQDADFMKKNASFFGEIYLGHLRYGTHGGNSIQSCHPFIRKNNWRSRNLVLAGNFNLTNVDDLIDYLVEIGQHPIQKRDTVTVMEKMGHFLDREVQTIFDHYKKEGMHRMEITDRIETELDIKNVLMESAKDFDGGYTMAGIVGSGDAFVLRDPNGIRPAFYYKDDEVVVVASERPCIQTAFNVDTDQIKEVTPGSALIIKKDGTISEEQCVEPREKKSCSFERIYFSRGTDRDIYTERKELGYSLTKRVLRAVDYDYENTVFSFIPNTAEVAYYGLMQGVEEYINNHKKEMIRDNPNLDDAELTRLLNLRPRAEKIAVKDVKLRTFISDDNSRDELVSHVYDITHGSIKKGVDTLVMVDDSIVRGTTLEKSILSILDRLGPKKIIVVSSAPQIRYPDCYGIDMSKMQEFIVFRALDALIMENNLGHIKDEVYAKCVQGEKDGSARETNFVKELYKLFTAQQITDKVSEIVKPKNLNAEVEVIFQSLAGLHKACPAHSGDWYFSGDFPTPGGNRVVNRAFRYYMEGRDERAY